MAHLTNFSFEFFLWNFHRRCVSTFSIPWCKKVKNDQKVKSRGGSCLNRSAARLITKTSPSSDISRELLLARAGLPSLGTRRRMAKCILICKAYLGCHPRHLQRAFSPWISPGKRRQSPRTSPLSIRVQRPNKSFFQHSGRSFKQPPHGTDLLPLQPAETSLRHLTFQTFLTNNSVHMRFNIFLIPEHKCNTVKMFPILQFLDSFPFFSYLFPTLYNSLLLVTGRWRSNKINK